MRRINFYPPIAAKWAGLSTSAWEELLRAPNPTIQDISKHGVIELTRLTDNQRDAFVVCEDSNSVGRHVVTERCPPVAAAMLPLSSTLVRSAVKLLPPRNWRPVQTPGCPVRCFLLPGRTSPHPPEAEVGHSGRMMTSGRFWCLYRNVSVKLGGLKPRTVPPRYLGQPSPFTHPHLIKHGEVTPGLSQTEYELRRHRLTSLIEAQSDRLLGPSGSSSTHVAIVLSHPTRYMTNDIPYPFHQNQDFLYLSGILEPDSALVLYGKGRPDQAILFVPRRDPGRELWDGPRSGKDGAAALTGIERVHCTEELGVVLKSLKGTVLWYDGSQPAHPHLHQAHVGPVLEAGPMPHSLRPLTHSLRAVKSSAEVALMQEAGRITAQAFRRTMGLSQGDVDEAVLFAKFDFENRLHGANFLAYPPVVAGGNRANTLHYINNNQIIKDGEMVLLDGGCEYFGYVSDVTRTWPVNGKFSPAQAEVYEAVLEVQRSCLSLCSPGVSLDHIYSTMLALLGRQLRRLGVVKAGTSDADAVKAARRFCPHHVGHYLGMDVHDTPELSRSQPLQPGMAITIEPGLYICEDNDQVPERFRGLGVRIEDDVVIGDKGSPLILSRDAPKTIADVEKACAHR